MTLDLPTYLPSPNKPPIDYMKYIIAAILLIGIAFTFSRCSEAAKTQKAVEMVNANADAQNQVANEWLKVHPCVSEEVQHDSTVTHDTLFAEKKIYIPKVYTETKLKKIDTIIDNISVYADSTGITVKNLSEPQVITKTITKTIVDESLVNSLKDSVKAKDNQISYYKGQIDQKNDTIAQDRKDLTLFRWVVAGISALLLLSAFFNVKGLLTKIPKITLPKL